MDNPNFKQLIDFSGKMNMDTDPVLIGNGDYPYSRDVEFLTNSTNSSGAHIPRLGNQLAFDLGSVPVQNKTWRIYTEQLPPATNDFHLTIYDQNGTSFGTVIVQMVKSVTGGISQTTDVAAFITAKDPAAIVTGTATSATAGYIDITMTTIPGYDVDFTIGVSTPGISFEPYLEIRQEAYDVTASGPLIDISSNDLLRDLYIWSTPQTKLPETTSYTVTSVVNYNLTGQFEITFSSNHGLSSGMKIVLSGSNTAIDGDWIVFVTGVNSILLREYHSVYVPIATPFSVNLTLYSEAVGEIGVGVEDINTGIWTYTRLLRSKEFNFRTKKQIDSRPATRSALKDSFYFTDGYNNPRCFYYTKPFITDGALDYNGGRYSYGSIHEETKNILTGTGARIAYTSQGQSGGQLPAGNWRYAIRFTNDGIVATDPSQVTNPVSVCSSAIAFGTGFVDKIFGDEPGTITPKVNNLLISGIVPGLFKYVELLGVNYVGDAVAGYVITRKLLDGVSTSMVIQHSGTEADTTTLDAAVIGKLSASIKTALSNEIIDSRLTYSNLTYNQEKDLSAWALTFEHTLQKQSLPSVGSVVFGLGVGEYQDPDNINAYGGYMHNEVERFGVRVRFIDGQFWSSVFFVDDIAFTTYATNLKADGVSAASQWSDPNRRNGNAGFSNFDMTDISGGNSTTTIYVPYVRFENIDLDYLIDGVPIRDLIDRIEFVRCETIKEILASGVGVLGVTGTTQTGEAGGALYQFSSETPVVNPPVTAANIIEFPYVSGHSGNTLTTNPLYPYDNATYPGELANFTAKRKFCSFYSPDIFFGLQTIVRAVGDQVLNHGNPQLANIVNGITDNSPAYSQYAHYTGKTGIDNTTLETFTPSEVIFMNKGQGPSVIGGTLFSKLNYIKSNLAVDGTTDNAAGYVFYKSAADITQPSAHADYGLRYLQYYRPVTDKYGDPKLSVYVSCGAIFDITITTSSPVNYNIFGGPVFTQISYFKNRYGDTIDSGLGGGVLFYSQNRVNAQMKMKLLGTTQDPFPGIPNYIWLESQNQINEDYQSGYDARNDVQSFTGFNADAEVVSVRDNWVVWSDINLGDSPVDSFRSFPPGNYHALNKSYGAIMNHANANGEMITWQQRAFMRQFFNTRGTLEVKGISEVLIGDASVMSRDGVTMSRFGSLHKWSIVHGLTRNGDDVYMWINTEMKTVCHYGSNGTLAVSDEGVKSFFANNLKWVDGKDTPAAGEGIHGVYDQRFNNFYFTVKGTNANISDWDPAQGYTQGAIVYFSTDPFNVIGEAYESYTNVANFNHQPDVSPQWWRKVPDDGSYYNQYTIVFNGFKTGFIGFSCIKPNIYNRWQNTFLSPRPISPLSVIYLHNKGSYLTWYDYLGVAQEEVGILTGVINKIPDQTKWFEAIAVDCEIVPDSMDFETSNQESFLTGLEFEEFERSWFSPIKEDSSSNGLNDGNTSLLYGKYIKPSFNFGVGVYQKLSNLTVVFEPSEIIK